MPKFAANLSTMYNELEFLDRFSAAATDGFAGVEFWFPYDYQAGDIKSRLDRHGLTLALFNCSPGDWVAGERGIACLPGREQEFKRSMELALEYAQALGNKHLHVMAGLVQPGHERAQYRTVYLRNLAYAAQQAAQQGVVIVIEPINSRDMPGYFLNRQDEAHAICREVGAPNLKVLLDFYHCQIVEGDLATKMRRDIAGIGHMQIAGVPERHEPNCGEVHYPYLFSLMDELGYDGWVGCEYRPKAGTSVGLAWLNAWLSGNDGKQDVNKLCEGSGEVAKISL
jgi:hydroxypyruvate isomerase